MTGPKRDYSAHQRKVIRAYYENREAIKGQALSDLVSDVWLATTEAKRKSLWAKAEKILLDLGVPGPRVTAIVSARDARALADLATKGFSDDRKKDWARDAKDGRTQ